jgi:adenylate kinase
LSSVFTTAPHRANSVLFSALASSRSRVVFLGTPNSGLDRHLESLRSLTYEHVLVSDLIQAECERSSPLGSSVEKARRADLPVPDETLVAIVRKWFWSRRSGRGFILCGFPASPAQAMVFDEWLEARGETLDCAALVGPTLPEAEATAAHYEQQAILARLNADELDALMNPVRGEPETLFAV